MENKIIISIIFLVLISLAITAVVVFYPESKETKCLAKDLSTMKIDACYKDSNIIISLEKYQALGLNQIIISAFSKETLVNLTNLDSTNIKYSPGILPKESEIIIKFPGKINFCDTTRQLQIPECKKDIRIDITPGEKSDITSNQTIPDSDTLNPNLIDPERIWESSCTSEWTCTDWEQCENGVQRRSCVDKNNCPLSFNLPDFTRKCNTCQENWECTWSECRNRITTPQCTDKNNCNTQYNKPSALSCAGQCTPDVICTDWTSCRVNYNFSSITSGIQEIGGIKTKTCSDRNNCISTQLLTESCSIRVDIYSKNAEWCGQTYIEVYDKLTNALLSRVLDKKSADIPSVDIYFTTNPTQDYCPYCFNNLKDGDETGIDCGGSCRDC